MELEQSFIALIEQSIKTNWYLNALTDYKGITLQYRDVARKIEKIHILLENAGIEKGDKIAICGRNSAHWTVTYLAVITYGAVVVPILHEFKADQVHNIVNHSEARLLFVGDQIWENLNEAAMPHLEGIIELKDFGVPVSRSEKLAYARDHLNEIFGHKFPCRFRPDDISYEKEKSEDLAIINYTSGTTGYSKGVMLPYRAIWGNLDHILFKLKDKVKPGGNIVCTLPMAHMYGLAVEFFFGFLNGCHLYFLTRLPSPTLIAETFAEIKPSIIVTVPLVAEKIIRKKILPVVQTNRMRLLLNMPVISKKVKQKIREQVLEVFGGKAYEMVVGGAPINQSIETFLQSIDFPLTIAYGTTETAPLIAFSDQSEYELFSCGKIVRHMEMKINSSDPENIPGELLVKGTNLMLGYYKNEEATREVIDEDGWFHTGDRATMSSDGHIYIKGRIKNMLLGANGQNIYPEEIEDKLNSMTMVNESLVVQHGNQLVGLVYPDMEEAQAMGFNEDDLKNIMEQNRLELNTLIPPFCKISEIRIHNEEFKKTPKKSIKRYLYKIQDT